MEFPTPKSIDSISGLLQADDNGLPYQPIPSGPESILLGPAILPVATTIPIFNDLDDSGVFCWHIPALGRVYALLSR